MCFFAAALIVAGAVTGQLEAVAWGLCGIGACEN